MNSDEERTLFERWGWTLDHVARVWRAPEHAHMSVTRARRLRGTMCRQTLSLDDLVAATRTPEGEGILVGFVISHGVRKK